MNFDKQKKDQDEKGKVKGTSAFKIKQTNNVEEISWSNNKYESTYEKKND